MSCHGMAEWTFRWHEVLEEEGRDNEGKLAEIELCLGCEVKKRLAASLWRSPPPGMYKTLWIMG